MPPRDPNVVQLDFPQLTADLIAQLNLVGTIGLLNFADTVVPTFLVGSRGLSFEVNPPDFTSAQSFFASAAAPAANTVLADTGQLPAGTYDLRGSLSFNGNGTAGGVISIQHRNAANTVTLATLIAAGVIATVQSLVATLPPIGYVIAEDERIRVVSPTTAFVGTMSGSVQAAIRPIP